MEKKYRLKPGPKPMGIKSTTFQLSPEDLAKLDKIQKAQGLVSRTDALRWLIREQ